MISALSLRYFGQVVRSGSFRAAANSLCVAPSAISRQIAVLEEELDAPLLERGRGRSVLKLTAAGEILMQLGNSTGHPLFHRESVRLSDCAEYGLALPDASIGAKQIYDDVFAKAGIRPRSVLVTNSNELLSLRPEVHMGHRYIPIKDARVKPQRMTLCVRKGRSLSVIALTFIEHLLLAFKQLETS